MEDYNLDVKTQVFYGSRDQRCLYVKVIVKNFADINYRYYTYDFELINGFWSESGKINQGFDSPIIVDVVQKIVSYVKQSMIAEI